ncbi:TonB-dependent receptor [Prolixibacteraceae bacterium JC049]|nr:TonB-dependent receptor [Prolixibacteraceae bacterium JC049]
MLEETEYEYKIENEVILIRKKPIVKSSSTTLVTQQEKKRITGTVTDAEGGPLPGVTIMIVGSTRGVITDPDGHYDISVNENDRLHISFIGMESQIVELNGRTTINVVLQEKSEELADVTVVAFGKQKKESVIASIQTVDVAELKVPSSNLTTALAGSMAGIISYQRSGEPGEDNAEFFVRGVTTFGYKKDPLILIDNIELTSSDLARLNPDDIESFSIMKDATATALYGARGANGVILVTTKEGKRGKAQFSIRYENSISTPTQEIELADPITYMKLHNEAYLTRDPLAQVPYTNEKIDKTVPGSNSLIFPSTDWREIMTKNSQRSNRLNLNVRGGGKVARYYVAASYNRDNGILDVDHNSDFNSNIKFQNYSLRSNINIDLTSTTEMIVRLSGSFNEYNGPIGGGSHIYGLIMQSNPVLFPAQYPKVGNLEYLGHTCFGNAGDGNYLNPYAELVRGYQESGNSRLGAQLEFKQDFNFLLKGLKGRFLINTTRGSSHKVSRTLKPYFYGLTSYDYYANTYEVEILNPDKGSEYLTYEPGDKNISSATYIEAALNYQRNFNKHGVSALLVGQLRHKAQPNAKTIQESLPYRNIGLSGRLTYNYDNKYFIETNFGYNGSERFAKKHRYGFFPSIGAGWLISNENFFEGLKNNVNNLKLRATHGLVGNDAIGKGRFLYLSNINMSSGSYGSTFGENWGYSRPGVEIKRYSDPNITWETATKTNFALEVGLWNELNVIAEYYFEKRDNILQERKTIPGSMGLWVTPYANVGKAKGKGYDISLDYNKSINPEKQIWVNARANFTYATSEFTYYEDYKYQDEYWKNKEDYPISQRWGYIAEGLFVDESEVLNSPKQFGSYKAGDIKYRDVNKDGVINSLDQVPIGFPTRPEIVYGFGGSFGYGGFDFSMFFQGLARESFWIDYNKVSPFFDRSSSFIANNALIKDIADNHWSEDNRDTHAFWPRLSTSSISNNSQTSTWFMRDGSFLRLKRVELGYTLPRRWMKKMNINKFRIYCSGTNLLTWSKFKLWDPEMAGDGLKYPIQKVFNLGVNINF